MQNIRTRIEAELIRRLVANAAIPLIGVACGTVLIVAIHWPEGRHGVMLAWAAAVFAALAVRLWLTLRFRRRLDEGGAPADAGRRYAMTTFLSGAAWGAGGLLVLGADTLALVVTITGYQAMVMGSVVTLGAYMPAFLSFALPAMLPLLVGLALTGDFAGWVMALYSGIFFLLMIGIARRFNRSLVEVLTLNFEKQDLVEELTVAHRQAAAGEQAKSRFLATMSHEIRTPMNGIIGLSRLMLEQPLQSEAKDLAETVNGSARALLGILDDILDFSKLEAGRLEVEAVPVDLHRLLNDVVRLMRPRAEEKGVALTLRLAPALPVHARTDATRLRQILLNLVGNAVKFTERGAVTVEVAPRGAGRVAFSVADTGIGIPAEAMATLFSEFVQGDGSIARRFGGTGLGLAISRRLAELMGGTITADSAIGRGSTFVLELPLGHATAEEVAALQLPPSPVELPPLRILLAEDNIVNQKVALGILRRRGHAVEVARDGLEAVAMVEGGDFDVVLMDMQMPNLDGLEATRRIRALPGGKGRLPIIAMTANALKGDDERCLAAGMDGYVTKPVDPAALFAVLARHVPAREEFSPSPACGRGSG